MMKKIKLIKMRSFGYLVDLTYICSYTCVYYSFDIKNNQKELYFCKNNLLKKSNLVNII